MSDGNPVAHVAHHSGHKIGPLPVWGWGLLIGAVGVAFLYFHSQSTAAADAGTGAIDTGTSDALPPSVDPLNPGGQTPIVNTVQVADQQTVDEVAALNARVDRQAQLLKQARATNVRQNQAIAKLRKAKPKPKPHVSKHHRHKHHHHH